MEKYVINSDEKKCDITLFKRFLEKFDFSINLEEYDCLLILKHIKNV